MNLNKKLLKKNMAEYKNKSPQIARKCLEK